MKHFAEQFKNEARKIRITVREREAMRGALEKAMRAPGPVSSPVPVVRSPFVFFAPRILAPTLALVLVVLAGAAYTAGSSLPGDLLYLVKVAVNEPVALALASDLEDKAAVRAALAKRRVLEAEALLARDALTPERRAALEERFLGYALAAPSVERAASVREESAAPADADISASSMPPESAQMTMMAMDAPTTLESAALEPVPQRARRASPFSVALSRRLLESASSTLAEAEKHFASPEGKLDADTLRAARADLALLRARITSFEGGKADEATASAVFKDAARLHAFLEKLQ